MNILRWLWSYFLGLRAPKALGYARLKLDKPFTFGVDHKRKQGSNHDASKRGHKHVHGLSLGERRDMAKYGFLKYRS